MSGTGYNIQDIAASVKPASAAQEHRLWYQYYFNTARGVAGLTENRRDVCRLLWKLWSPNWEFDEATFEASARSFDNPDFVAVVIQSYRHRYGYVAGRSGAGRDRGEGCRPSRRSPCRRSIFMAKATASAPSRVPITVRRSSPAPYERRLIPKVGHNVPQEAPNETVAAIRDLMKGTEP